jgi:hypothetical protein
MPNKDGWDHDGTTFRVFSDDVEVLETPFPTAGDPAEQVLGKDPATGRPKWNGALAPATITDIVPPDTGPLPLPDATTIATTPTVPTTPVPDPVVDMCPQIRCGAAHQLAQKLYQQYGLIRTLLLWMVSAPFVVIGSVEGLVGTLTVRLLTALLNWLVKTEAEQWMVLVITAVLAAVRVDTFGTPLTFEALDGAGKEQLALLAYVNLECADNTFKLSPAMVANWGAAILLDDVNFTEWQRHLLGYCIQFTPFGTYDQTAASGAQYPSDTCSGWTWG